MAGNRTGKTMAIGYFIAMCVTGLYPDWWEGKRFSGAIDVWACCVTNREIGEVLNKLLLGDPGQLGTGLIPKDYILTTTRMPGVPNTIESCEIKCALGGVSRIGFKSYQQDRDSYQGTAKHIVWYDEEPPQSLYSEGLTRTAVLETVGRPEAKEKGLVVLSFTPLKGLSDVVMAFMPNGKIPEDQTGSKRVISATWEDIPHIDEATKQELASAYLPFEIEARTKGIPCLGSGAIYPIPDSLITVAPFKIPDTWPRWYGGDCGVHHTAVVFYAKDPNTGTKYIYAEYTRGAAELAVHVEAIKTHGGNWMRGVMDAADVATVDGRRWIQLYRDAGLDISLPNKIKGSVESGIQTVANAMSSGTFKVFSSCVKWFEEFHLYRRDEKGDIVKKNDHLMDATRYGMMVAESSIPSTFDDHDLYDSTTMDYIKSADAGKNKITGY